MTGWGGFVSLPALGFCATHKIAVVILDWDRDFMTVMAVPARRAARIARAQLAALSPTSALVIAKALIASKIEAHARVGAIVRLKADTAIERVREADTEPRLLMIEAQAARLAWVERPVVMRWRESGNIPASWKLPFLQRRRLDRKFSRHATDPINAMLNLALAVTTGRLVVAPSRSLALKGRPYVGVLIELEHAYRMAARIDNGRVQLLTRTGLDWTEKYPSAIAALANMKAGMPVKVLGDLRRRLDPLARAKPPLSILPPYGFVAE
jgi:hypothetical protein